MGMVEVGQCALDGVRQAAPEAQAEVFLVSSEGRVSEWSEGAPENRVIAQTNGLGLRTAQNGRLGFGYVNQWDTGPMRDLVRQTLSAGACTTADSLLELPGAVSAPPMDDLDLMDASLARAPWEERARFLETVESDAKKRDRRIAKLLRGSYRESTTRVAVMSSRGTSASYEATQVSFGLACVAVDQGDTQIGYAFQAARHYADLEPSSVIGRAVDHAVGLLGGRRIPSGRYDVVLDPFVAAEMLSLFAGALEADQVQKGKSFLARCLGQVVGAPGITLVDDGRLPRGVGSAPIDGEGLPTQKTIVIREGRLEGFLYDSYSARKEKRRSTGNAGRGSYKSLPRPEATNFYLAPGNQGPEAIIASIQAGLYVTGVMGLHTVDTVSGDYSLGLMGQCIEGGVRTRAVRGVTMAGNLLDLLKQVAAVGSDLQFFGSVGSPTVWIRSVSVGGEA